MPDRMLDAGTRVELTVQLSVRHALQLEPGTTGTVVRSYDGPHGLRHIVAFGHDEAVVDDDEIVVRLPAQGA